MSRKRGDRCGIWRKIKKTKRRKRAELDISLDILFKEELNYLKKKTLNDKMEKYPGAEVGLKVFAEYLSKL